MSIKDSLYIFSVLLLCFSIETLAQERPQRPSDSNDQEAMKRYFRELNEYAVDQFSQKVRICQRQVFERSNPRVCRPENNDSTDLYREDVVSSFSRDDRYNLSIAANACLQGAYFLQYYILSDSTVITRRTKSWAETKLRELILLSLTSVATRCRTDDSGFEDFCPSTSFWENGIGRSIRIAQQASANDPENPMGVSREGRTLWLRCGPDSEVDCNCQDGPTGQIYHRFGRMQRQECLRQLKSCEGMVNCNCLTVSGEVYHSFGRMTNSRCQRQTCPDPDPDPDPIIPCECRADGGNGRLLYTFRTRRSDCLSRRPC